MKKKVFIIEDDPKKRKSLRNALTNRGFETYAAGTVKEARDIAEEHWETLDVMVADMLMEEDIEPQTTGAHIGIEFRRKKRVSPECFILTNYPKVEYYKLALDLGASAFLDKISFDSLDIVRYVRALSLRKNLSVENPKTFRKILKIVTQSSDRAHAIKMFCQRVFAKELMVTLGAPFLLILTTENKSSEYCAGNAELPMEANELYQVLQAVAQPEINKSEPTPLDLSNLANETGVSVPETYRPLQGALLLPIFSNSEFQISLTMVILKEARVNLDDYEANQEVVSPGRVVEDPIKLWKVLNQYLKPTVVEHLLTIFSEWNHIKTTLREISQICIWIGQEQTAILRNSRSFEDPVLDKLRAMAHDLTESGNLLRHIEKPLDETSEVFSCAVRPLLSEVWDDIQSAEGLQGQIEFDIEGDSAVDAKENDLYVVFSRLLQWFVKRGISVLPGRKAKIKITCHTDGKISRVTFTDNSERMSELIRRELFVPFTQSVAIPFSPLSKKDDEHHIPGQYLPLYIAKMIIEVKYGGEFVDLSDELEGNNGHKMVVSFLAQGL